MRKKTSKKNFVNNQKKGENKA